MNTMFLLWRKLMAFGSFLALRHRDGPGRVIKYNLFGQTEQIGNEFGSAETTPVNVSRAMASNRVVQFKGVNDLYAFLGDNIWHYDGDGTTGGDWSIAYTLSVPSTSTSSVFRVGPFVTDINGRPAMSCVYYTSTVSQWRGVTSFDGVTWEETESQTLFTPRILSPSSSMWGEHVFDDVIYFFCTNNASPQYPEIIYFNPACRSLGYWNASTSVQAFQIEDGQSQSANFCVFRDKHYVIANKYNVNSVGLYEFSGGGYFDEKATFASTQMADPKFCLFTDVNQQNAMYSLTLDPATYDWNASKWAYNSTTNAFTRSDITSSVLPSGLFHSTIKTDHLYGRWTAIYDFDSNQTILAYARSGQAGDSRWSFYTWNGESSLIGVNGAPNGTGGSGSDALTLNYHHASGSRFWRETDPIAIIEDRDPVLNGERLQFRLYSKEDMLTVDVELLYETGIYFPATQGTLSDPSAGSLMGNVINGLTADPMGSTLYEVTWLSSSDGIGKGQPVKRLLKVTRT